MEKFGIFNILSALSNLTSQKSQDKKPEPPKDNAKPPKENSGNGGAVFQPPSYPSYQPMLNFINKHDEISKRIDRNNKN